jgi:hypothetical protein
VVVITSSLGKNTENLIFREVFFYVRNALPKSIETVFLKIVRAVAKLCSFSSFTFSWNRIVESDDKFVTEPALGVKTLLLKLQTRRGEHFIRHMVKKYYLVQDGEMTMQRYFRASKEFYDTVFLSYLEAWNNHNKDIFKLTNACHG